MTASTRTMHQPAAEPRSVVEWDSQGLVASAVVKATPCVLLELRGVNTSASTRYVQVFDSATVPADSAVPSTAPIPVAAGAAFSVVYPHGVTLTAGLSIATSSTAATKTVGSAELWATAVYR